MPNLESLSSKRPCCACIWDPNTEVREYVCDWNAIGLEQTADQPGKVYRTPNPKTITASSQTNATFLLTSDSSHSLFTPPTPPTISAGCLANRLRERRARNARGKANFKTSFPRLAQKRRYPKWCSFKCTSHSVIVVAVGDITDW